MKLYKSNITLFSEKDYNDAFSMMDDQRKASVLRKKIENDRKRSILGEYLARKGISELCDIAPEEIKFDRTENGKPFAINADVFFSISHCNDMVVCAISKKPIGIDIEFLRDIELNVTRFACTEKDNAFIFETQNIDEQRKRFFKLWTAKEAFLKCYGKGISDLKTVSFCDIEPFCKTVFEDGFYITVYEGEN